MVSRLLSLDNVAPRHRSEHGNSLHAPRPERGLRFTKNGESVGPIHPINLAWGIRTGRGVG